MENEINFKMKLKEAKDPSSMVKNVIKQKLGKILIKHSPKKAFEITTPQSSRESVESGENIYKRTSLINQGDIYN